MTATAAEKIAWHEETKLKLYYLLHSSHTKANEQGVKVHYNPVVAQAIEYHSAKIAELKESV